MCSVIRIVTFPARVLLNAALDVAFGKPDGEPYTSVTRRD